MRVLLSSHTLAISSTCEVWFPVNRGERNESRIVVTPDPSVFLEGLARETSKTPVGPCAIVHARVATFQGHFYQLYCQINFGSGTGGGGGGITIIFSWL